jgi:integrase
VDVLKIMAGYLKKSGRLIDARNSALLQIGFLDAFRRSELVAISWEHIRFVDHCFVLQNVQY